MDDLTPDPLDGEPGPIYTSRRRRNRMMQDRRLRLFGLLVVVAAAGVGAWLWHRSGTGTKAVGPASDSLPGQAAVSTPPAPANPTLPPLDSSDTFVRSMALGMSSHPRLAKWLATDKLIHRFVVTVVDIANGKSPEDQVPFLVPERPFQVRSAHDTVVEDTSSYHRYDELAATVASLDVADVGRLYRELSPLMEDAYHDLGIRDGSTFQEALARAFGRLLAVRFPNEPPVLVPKGVVYGYASPRLDSLSPAAKHLLRLGPTNGSKVQDKLRELASAMGVKPVAPAQGGA